MMGNTNDLSWFIGDNVMGMLLEMRLKLLLAPKVENNIGGKDG